MSRTERSRPNGAALAVGAVIAAVALAGCGAGQIAQTAEQVAAVGGANNAGNAPIAVRDVKIEYSEDVEGAVVWPRGGDAPLSMTVINQSDEEDRLVSASSPIAASVRITGETDVPSGLIIAVEGTPAPAPSATPAPGATGTAAPTGSATATPAPGATGTPVPRSSATPNTGEAPASGLAPTPGPIQPGTREAQVVLTELREDVRAGLTYPIVLVFERAGEIRLQVPVANPSEERQDQSGE